MTTTFPIIQVKDSIGDEPLGTKTKFWFQHEEKHWLYKEARENTGEDWAEKIAAELASLLEINAATVELAEHAGKRGCACLSFVNDKVGDVLIHGNEILAGQVFGYDPKKRFHQSNHTLENIQTAISALFKNQEIHEKILTELASYLVLDALIGNTDRHHENWGLLMKALTDNNQFTLHLEVAPTYDHASSLGRELKDERRSLYINQRNIETYIRRGSGAIFLSEADRHGANPLKLAELAVHKFPNYFKPSLDKLNSVRIEDIFMIIDQVPQHLMTDLSKQFTKEFLKITYNALCKLVK